MESSLVVNVQPQNKSPIIQDFSMYKWVLVPRFESTYLEENCEEID